MRNVHLKHVIMIIPLTLGSLVNSPSFFLFFPVSSLLWLWLHHLENCRKLWERPPQIRFCAIFGTWKQGQYSGSVIMFCFDLWFQGRLILRKTPHMSSWLFFCSLQKATNQARSSHSQKSRSANEVKKKTMREEAKHAQLQIRNYSLLFVVGSPLCILHTCILILCFRAFEIAI